jgi:hypothetical protein
MPENISPLNEEEQLKAENDFIKMKLMLENGAEFGTASERELSPGMENEFLKYIMEYEKQAENLETIRLFDKIERPAQFRPVAEIPDEKIEAAWESLSAYLDKYGISLDVSSPNINARELYRFTVEELFEYQMDDMNMPGLMHMFSYDEFHPDPVYESERVVQEDLFPGLFKAEPVGEYFLCLHQADIRLNGKLYPSDKHVKDAFDHFKSFFSTIHLLQTTIEQCTVTDPAKVDIRGNYKARAITLDDKREILFESEFMIELRPDDLGYWSIKSMQIGAISF